MRRGIRGNPLPLFCRLVGYVATESALLHRRRRNGTVSNLIRLRSPGPRAFNSEVGDELLTDPPPHSHAVHFYESDEFLFDKVGRFLAAGLQGGDRMVVIATGEHRTGFAERVRPFDVNRAIAAGQLVMLDARQTLATFMIGDMPDPDLFRETISRVFTRLAEGHPQARIRAYGEMVDLLWREGNSKAAIRLEELWNDAGKDHSFSLLCAYVMGNFYKEGDTARFMEVCRAHSHVIPTESFTEVSDAQARLREISMLQQRARALESEIAHRKELEGALRDALRDRSRVEEELRASVKREQAAREQAEASDAYKEMLLGILGHDLRNPLNTILTTAQLMTIRGELAPDDRKHLQRMATSAVRMSRMIEQLLDATQGRLADGIPVNRSQPHDLVPIVKKIVEELRAAHPEGRIEVRAPGPCLVHLDPDRFEQVVSNLVGNALSYGDPARTVTVAVALCEGEIRLSVHNFGPPIDPALLPSLFDPFKRRQGYDRVKGLGLGLYIADRIVSAHAGRIEVQSTLDAGTHFEVILPRSLH
jgi:signal transduction histidine kinase